MAGGKQDRRRLATAVSLAIAAMLIFAMWLTRQPALASPLAEAALLAPARDLPPGFVGAEACASCHAAESLAWRGSHHAAAMQLPSAETVKGAFDGRRFAGPEDETRFFQRDGRYIIATAGPDGRPGELPSPIPSGSSLCSNI